MSRGSPSEIAFWLGTLRQVPSVEEIAHRWQVARATAFRWRAFALSGGRSQQTQRERSPAQDYDHYTRQA